MSRHLRSEPREEDHAFRTHQPNLIFNSRKLRSEMTPVERMLWSALSKKQSGHRFRRQHPVGSYIADFCCIKQRLIIELDGSQHQQQKAYDAKRTADLEQLGYRVLRFWNIDVIENLEGVYETILTALDTPPKLETATCGDARESLPPP